MAFDLSLQLGSFSEALDQADSFTRNYGESSYKEQLVCSVCATAFITKDLHRCHALSGSSCRFGGYDKGEHQGREYRSTLRWPGASWWPSRPMIPHGRGHPAGVQRGRDGPERREALRPAVAAATLVPADRDRAPPPDVTACSWCVRCSGDDPHRACPSSPRCQRRRATRRTDVTAFLE